MITPYYENEEHGITVYCGDCLEVMKDIPDGSIDAVITDPPYGIDWSGCPASTLEWNKIANDATEYDLRWLLNMDCLVISFGANCYPDQLPHRGRWICWDKRTSGLYKTLVDTRVNADNMLGSPFELAWTNNTHGFDKIYRIQHGGVVNADEWGKRREHPTQKPIKLLRNIIEDYTNPGDTILDPFLGSGTTAIAAYQTGRRCIGIEISEEYCNIAVKRIKEAVAQKTIALEV